MDNLHKWRIALEIDTYSGMVTGAFIVSEPNPTSSGRVRCETSSFAFPTYEKAEAYLRTSIYYSWLRNFCVWKDEGRAGWVRRN